MAESDSTRTVAEILLAEFPELSRQERERMTEAARISQHPRGAWIFAEGAAEASTHWLVSGRVELLKNSLSGKSTILHVMTEGHFLDLCALFGSGETFYSAIALSPCRILHMDSRRLLSILQQNAPFALRLMKALAVRQRMFINKIAVSQGKISVRRRVAGWLLHKARMEKSLTLDDGITREVLAGLLGLSRESLSRQISQFARDGLIRIERRSIAILDEAALRRCLEE